MAAEPELLVTKFLNDNFAGLGNTLTGLVGIHPEDRPWADYVAMQLIVALFIIVLFAVLKPRLSVDRPGKFQHIFELIHEFVTGQADEQVGHDGRHYAAYFGTVFIFVLFANLIGLIPGFMSPTMVPSVPAGIAIATFCYYNIMGVQANGVFKYLAHFAGPIWWMAPLMIPIEICSHLARPLSLTIRLFANMYAGEQVTGVFLRLTLLLVPTLFMGLHVFVSFLQAYIFMLLTMMYVAGAVAHEH
jgi:F-type H+-transporting ATPase subunit a